jgi:tRNA(His) 5'-end guanylyltransferase
MTISLTDRHKEYENSYDFKITKKLPVIIRVDGKSFSRFTKNLEKPFCTELAEVMSSTMLQTATEMQGCVFGYHQSDEITFVLRNDQSLDSEPWFDNRIQKMSSIASSLVTLNFNRNLSKYNLNVVGDGLFDARVFPVPSIAEAVNNLIGRQKDGIRNAISQAARHELHTVLGRKTSLKLTEGKTTAQRKDLLFEHCGIDYDDYYSSSFRHGIATYKVPSIISTAKGDVQRNKWVLNYNIPNFMEDKDFLYNILVNGKDVFRQSSFENT